MVTVDVKTGSKEWHEHRAKYFNASDAPAVLGKGKMSREELLDKYKGYQEEVSDFTQKIFNKGHELEADALYYAELEVGDDLYPLIGVNGTLSASFDGITLDERIIYEHKTLNAEIKQSGATLAHKIQVQQQFMVSGAYRCLFLATNGVDEHYQEWLEPDLELQEQIKNGWELFSIDLEHHEIKQKNEAPVTVAVLELPSVIIQVKGELTLCNISDVRPVFDKFLQDATVNLVTDNDFAIAEAESKKARDIAKRCIATEKNVIDQTASISEVTRELRMYADKFNALALQQENAVKTQKDNIKIALLNKSTAEFGIFIKTLNDGIKPIYLKTQQPNFMEAMKGKRTISSLEDAIVFELSKCQSIAVAAAALIGANLKEIAAASEYKFLLNDFDSLVLMDIEHLKMTIDTRIRDHRAAEAQRIIDIEAAALKKAQEDLLESEREKIRLEVLADQKAVELEKERTWMEEEAKLQLDAEFVRKTASSIEQCAQYADSAADRNAELAGAAKIRQQADDIEKSLKPTDAEILASIVFYFNCSQETACMWLRGLDINKLEAGL